MTFANVGIPAIDDNPTIIVMTSPKPLYHRRGKGICETRPVTMFVINHHQTGLPVPYILEPYRTVPCIFEPNRLPARNFRARAEPNRGPNARARQCTVRIIYEPNRIDCWNARFGMVRLGDVRLKVM